MRIGIAEGLAQAEKEQVATAKAKDARDKAKNERWLAELKKAQANKEADKKIKVQRQKAYLKANPQIGEEAKEKDRVGKVKELEIVAKYMEDMDGGTPSKTKFFKKALEELGAELAMDSSVDADWCNCQDRAMDVLMRAQDKKMIDFADEGGNKKLWWVGPRIKGRAGASRSGPASKAQQPEAASTVRRSSRNVLMTASQKKAQQSITKMEEGTRTALMCLDRYKQELPEPYSVCHRRYPAEYVGNGKCHLRALHNVNPDAAAEACQLRIKYQHDNQVLDILRKHKHKQDTEGQVFRSGNHWVAVESTKGTNEGVYYDDKILMKVNNFKGAVACLELLTQGKTEKQIARNLRSINVENNVSNDTWAKTMKTMAENFNVSTRERKLEDLEENNDGPDVNKEKIKEIEDIEEHNNQDWWEKQWREKLTDHVKAHFPKLMK